ncbi:MAG: CBS domain-containing protein [Anaerolineae bacterium]|nr:MAG: CBS domain-containing protein [Anaerolineae bacterium]
MQLSKSIRRVRTFQLSENTLLVALGVLVGLSTGIGVWVFRIGIEAFHEHFREAMVHELGLGDWGIVIVLPLAGVIVGLLMHIFVGEERHHGVAGILEAEITSGGRLPYRRIPVKAFCAALSLGAGASVGPEDPSVQIGSNLGSFFGQRLRLTEERTRLLVSAGAASAIAAAFNAPLAGIFFALEVILAEFTTASFGLVVLSAVISSVFTQSVESGHPELGIRAYELGGPLEIPFYIFLGAVAAPVSVGFMRLVFFQHDLWHRLKVPRPFKTALAGVLVAIVAVYYPQIMGPGRETMNEVLNTGGGDFTVRLLVALVIAKIVMTSVSMAGGFVGGIFAPALFVGAMLGGAYGRIVNEFAAIESVGDPAGYAIAGMAAVMAGVVRAPITAILLIFELTNDYRLILPILLTTVVCVALAEQVEPDGIYTRSLRKHGIEPQQGRDIDLMQAIKIAEVMTVPAPTISPDATLTELRQKFREFNTRALCVSLDGEYLLGIVTLTDLQNAYEIHQDDIEKWKVKDIYTPEVVAVTPQEPVWVAIRLMAKYRYRYLPVVAENNPRQILGILQRSSIMEGYSLAIARKWESQYVQNQVRLHNLVDESILELRVKAASPIAGKQVKDVHWPPQCVIASVRRDHKVIVPQGSTSLKIGDVLTIVIDPHCEQELYHLFG